MVHDEVSGSLANKRKEELREKIEEIQAMGGKKCLKKKGFCRRSTWRIWMNQVGRSKLYLLAAGNASLQEEKIAEGTRNIS